MGKEDKVHVSLGGYSDSQTSKLRLYSSVAGFSFTKKLPGNPSLWFGWSLLQLLRMFGCLESTQVLTWLVIFGIFWTVKAGTDPPCPSFSLTKSRYILTVPLTGSSLFRYQNLLYKTLFLSFVPFITKKIF